MTQPKIHAFPAHQAKPSQSHWPLLFLHGGFSHSAYWNQHFIPFFQHLGYSCYALDFSGHGASSGQDKLDSLSLDDYVQDLTYALDKINPGGESVIISHSMGSLVTQRYLGKGVAQGVKGAVFIAPVPASGTATSALSLSLSNPDFFGELERVTQGQHPTPRALEMMSRIYFSPKTPQADILRTLPMIQPESTRAIAEMATAPLPIYRRKPDIPVLFMAGSADAVFPSSILTISAFGWKHHQVHIVPGAGHMLMLDVQWREGASAIQHWLEQHKF